MDFMCLQYKSLKTRWEKKKLLITSNFFLFPQCFYPLEDVSAFSSNLKLLCANSFNLDHFGNEQFFVFPQCFLPVWRTFCLFHQIWNCQLPTLSIWTSLVMSNFFFSHSVFCPFEELSAFFKLSTFNSSNLGQSRILSFGKELIG